ncbi:MAG: hypothetical protein ACRDJI_09220 [Actinomycetota bacterium]
MSPLLHDAIAAARREELLREAEAHRMVARASRRPREGFRHRLGAKLVRAGSALIGQPRASHSR